MFLKSAYYESLLGYENECWFVKEIKKLKTKKAFCLKKSLIKTLL